MAQEFGSFLYVDLLFSLVWVQIQLSSVVYCKYHTSDLEPFAEGTFFKERKPRVQSLRVS
jgi:hypothetical protein